MPPQQQPPAFQPLGPSSLPVVLCPQVESLGRVVAAGGPGSQPHIHIACALWIPEVTLSRPDWMDGVVLDRLPADRVARSCSLCRQGGGAVVRCSHGGCCTAFHVLCGRAAGQLLAFRRTDGEPLAFCRQHSTPAYEEVREALIEGRVPVKS